MIGKNQIIWTGSAGGYNGTSFTFNLDCSITNFDKIGFVIGAYLNTVAIRYYYTELEVSSLMKFFQSSTDNRYNLCWGYLKETDYFDIISDSTDTTIVVDINRCVCYKIIGVRS